MSIATQFPRRSYVVGDDGKIGRVAATTEKFGGRVKVRELELTFERMFDGDRWIDAKNLRVVGDDERILDCNDGCGGTGVFRGGGIVENGVYKGYSGPCYRCEGHGKQTPKDRRRNSSYDRNYRRVSL